MNANVKWPVIVCTLLAVPVVANGYLMYRANSDPSFAIVPDYYKKALAWDAHRAEVAASTALGWHVAIEHGPSLRLHVADKDGLPVDGAAVTVEAFHNADANHVQTAHLVAAPDHSYAAPLRFDRRGLWELRVSVVRGVDRFDMVLREDIGE